MLLLRYLLVLPRLHLKLLHQAKDRIPASLRLSVRLHLSLCQARPSIVILMASMEERHRKRRRTLPIAPSPLEALHHQLIRLRSRSLVKHQAKEAPPVDAQKWQTCDPDLRVSLSSTSLEVYLFVHPLEPKDLHRDLCWEHRRQS